MLQIKPVLKENTSCSAETAFHYHSVGGISLKVANIYKVYQMLQLNLVYHVIYIISYIKRQSIVFVFYNPSEIFVN